MKDTFDWTVAANPHPGATNPHLGRRFDAAGVFLPENGNTVVCQVIPGSATEAALTDLRLVLQALSHADHFAFTEIASYHMTLFEGVIESRRAPPHWPADLAPDLDIDRVTDAMVARLDGFVAPPAFRITPLQVTPFGLRLAGATATDDAHARQWRDLLAVAFGIRAPNHDSYGFHTTLAYAKSGLPPAAIANYQPVMDRLTQDFKNRIDLMDLAPPAFCRFRDMNAFPPVRML
jgi:hypothetical protein